MNSNNIFQRFIKIGVYFFILILVSCGGQKDSEEVKVSDIHNPQTADGISKKEESKSPVLTFEHLEYDFGKVIQGEKLNYSFKFKNTGKSNLIIYNTEASCGCTTSTPPKAPIRPGESSEIVISFNSTTQKGEINKVIVVSANTYPVQTVLRIKANVIVP